MWRTSRAKPLTTGIFLSLGPRSSFLSTPMLLTCIQPPQMHSITPSLPTHKWTICRSLHSSLWNLSSTGSTYCLRCLLRYLRDNAGFKMSKTNLKSGSLARFNLSKWYTHHTTNLQVILGIFLLSPSSLRSPQTLRFYFLNLICYCLFTKSYVTPLQPHGL